MSSKKFKFVSPGIFLQEVDNSQLPNLGLPIGPVIIGRTERGPAMRPVRVESFSEFIEVFGNPIPGGDENDVWRNGNYTSPTHASYAAQAYLRNNTPVTIVRLLGHHHSNATTTLTGGAQAGWATAVPNGGDGGPDTGGAYGLFVIQSGSATTVSTMDQKTGSLAAVFYVDKNAAITLSGNVSGYGSTDIATDAAALNATTSSAGIIIDSDSNGHFTVDIWHGSSVEESVTFNLDRDDAKYVRDVFNTNPTLVNTTTTTNDNQKRYWLGETFEYHSKHTMGAGGSVSSPFGNKMYGFIASLESGSIYHSDKEMSAKPARTGWFIAQDTSNNTTNYEPAQMQKLFRLVALSEGEWLQNNLKVSIERIKPSPNKADPWGTFDIVLRSIRDNDANLQVVERFSNLNFNPNSPNYIARRIGDVYVKWNETDKKYDEYGDYPNISKYVRVQMDTGATDAAYLPFGVHGPLRYKGFTVLSGSSTLREPGQCGGVTSPPGDLPDGTMVEGIDIPFASMPPTGSQAIVTALGASDTASTQHKTGLTASYLFPALPLRMTNDDSTLNSLKSAYFGVDTTRSGSSVRFEESCLDVVRALPDGILSDGTNDGTPTDASGSFTRYSWIFSLDNIHVDENNVATYADDNRNNTTPATGRSLTALSGTSYLLETLEYNKFTTMFHGGFDGLDIKEKDPFRNTILSNQSNPTETTSYVFNTLKRAIDSVADPEVVDYNLAAAPGITNSSITDHLIRTCENRGDALAVIDLEGDYQPIYEGTSETLGTVSTTITNLRNRDLNTSYGCAYYPWVQVRDTINNRVVNVPPSVAALGVMGFSETVSEVWFAPAGFNRGGLSDGAAGIPVVGVKQKLTSKDRDKLYDANINPIASFPAEGIVIFGQKTLQVTKSALDRINVRRLLIFVKKEISRMASTVLFDQNVSATWNRFLSKAKPFLADVKARFGLTDWKVVLDSSTTTPDLIDQNIMYAKVFLKPARAIEYIALDFVITSTGAGFED